MAYSINGAGPIWLTVSVAGGWSVIQPRPDIEITEGQPQFRAWPRDCTVITEARIILNCDKPRRGEIYKWLNTNGINYSPMHDHSFRLHDQETLTLFKLTWL